METVYNVLQELLKTNLLDGVLAKDRSCRPATRAIKRMIEDAGASHRKHGGWRALNEFYQGFFNRHGYVATR